MQKPKMVDEYNQYMGGVDKSDKLLSSYGFLHCTVKWWRCFFYHILYCQSPQCGRCLRHQQFHMELAKELLHSAGEEVTQMANPQSQYPLSRLTERQFPARTDITPDGKFLQPDCVVCSRKKGSARKTTSYICKQCKLPMSITPCFKLYHTKTDPLRYL